MCQICLYAHMQGGGDTVTARVLPNQHGKVVIDKIEGDNGRLSLDPAKNCIGIAALETLKTIGQTSCGVSLTLHKVRMHADHCTHCIFIGFACWARHARFAI